MERTDRPRIQKAHLSKVPLAFFFGSLLIAGCASSRARSTSSPLLDEIVAMERQGLDSLKSGNLAIFASLTADDAVFIDPHGPASKAEVMKNVAEFRLQDYSIEDVKLVRLSERSGLIAYKLAEKGSSHGREFTAKVFVSSIWAERDGKWMCLFSQETAAK